MTEMLPAGWQPASLQAERFEYLFWYIVAVTGTVGLAVYAALLYFCIRYRRGRSSASTPRILGSHRLELVWTIIPLIVFLTFFAWGVFVYNGATRAPADALTVNVIGKQWMWKAEYPGGQRVILGLNGGNGSATAERTEDEPAIVLPVDRPVQFRFISEDVIHDFGVPSFRTKMDVLPGRYTFAWYHPTKVGTFQVFCDQYCGLWHSKMVGRIKVVPAAEFEEFLRGAANTQAPLGGGPVDGSSASEGQQLFRKLQCISCHSPSAKSGTRTHPRAPQLEGLFGARVPLKGGGWAEANEDYIIESVINPRAKVVDGWEPIMPSYHGQVSAEELNQLVAYIQYLKTGRILPPNERFPAPEGAPRQPEPAPKTGSAGGGK